MSLGDREGLQKAMIYEPGDLPYDVVRKIIFRPRVTGCTNHGAVHTTMFFMRIYTYSINLYYKYKTCENIS